MAFFKNKTVLLTGASGGLGLALAKELLQKGYFVVLHSYHHKEKLQPLKEKYPHNTYLIEANFKKEEDIKEMKKTLQKEQIVITHLINNAAIDHVSALEEKTEDTFLEVLKINLIAPFLLIKEFGEEIDKNEGSIVNIASDNIIDTYDIVTLEYDISKAGLHQLTKTFANYYQKAKINTICFGWLDTPMNDFPENIKKEIPFVPLNKAVKETIKLLETEENGILKVVKK